MKILSELDAVNNNIDNGLSPIVCKCGCVFSTTESDIEEQIIPVPYDKGIKRTFGMAKGYIHNRYITCPSCFRKMKVKYCVEDFKDEQC